VRLPGRTRAFLEQDYDLVVIGGGPAGLAAARAGRWSGARVVLVTDRPGGEGRAGGIPSKALLAAAVRGQSFREAVAHARRTARAVAAAEDVASIRREGIDVLEGRARFVAPAEIDVGGRLVRTGRFVVATGSRPAAPAIAGLAGSGYLTTESVFELAEPPASMAIVGGGSTGCELAQALARLGVRVTLYEGRARLLPDHDPEAGDVVAGALRADGVDVRTSALVIRLEPDGTDGAARVVAARGETVVVARTLVATGRRGYTDGLDLPAAGVVNNAGGFIPVDEHLRTNVPGTYAAGDVTGLLPLAHAAEEMGRLAAGHALARGPRGPFRTARVPRVTFTVPEVAGIGVTEAESGPFSKVAYLPLSEIDRALVDGETHGFIKLIAAPRLPTAGLYGGRLVGATIVAPRAGEMIAEVGLALRAGMFPARLAQSVHAYPTWSAGVQRCAAQFVVEIDGRRARRARR
jgi:pyruvate/2-oxoglutarate dehydrogenase complex dihydrolipoamide dehydrogenase (E3) component